MKIKNAEKKTNRERKRGRGRNLNQKTDTNIRVGTIIGNEGKKGTGTIRIGVIGSRIDTIETGTVNMTVKAATSILEIGIIINDSLYSQYDFNLSKVHIYNHLFVF